MLSTSTFCMVRGSIPLPVCFEPNICLSLSQASLPMGQSMMEGRLPRTLFRRWSRENRPDRVLSRKLDLTGISQPKTWSYDVLIYDVLIYDVLIYVVLILGLYKSTPINFVIWKTDCITAHSPTFKYFVNSCTNVRVHLYSLIDFPSNSQNIPILS